MVKTEVSASNRKKAKPDTEEATSVMSEKMLIAEKPTEDKEEYDFHIRLHGKNIAQKLKDAATIAHGLGLIPKATLANLMSLFIDWGLDLLKQQWLEKVGHR